MENTHLNYEHRQSIAFTANVAKPINVLLAHSHVLVRRGLSAILMEMFKSVKVTVADSGPEVIGKCRFHAFDIVILDLKIPGLGAFSILDQIRRLDIPQNFLVLNLDADADAEELLSMRAIRAGAMGYLGKTTTESEMMEGLKSVLAGRQFFSGDLKQRVFARLREGTKSGSMETLSDRELDVLRLLRQGKSIKEVADELFLGAKTIYTHRDRIRQKLHIKSDRGLIMAHDSVNAFAYGDQMEAAFSEKF